MRFIAKIVLNRIWKKELKNPPTLLLQNYKVLVNMNTF